MHKVICMHTHKRVSIKKAVYLNTLYTICLLIKIKKSISVENAFAYYTYPFHTNLNYILRMPTTCFISDKIK